MNYNVSYPYVKVLCIYIKGNVDEGQPGYINPEDDEYLKDIKNRIHQTFIDNIWKGKKIGCWWDVLRSEIDGPSSSGYENTLNIIIGFNDNVHEAFDKPTTRWERFEELVKEFKENEM